MGDFSSVHRLRDVLDSLGEQMGWRRSSESGAVWARWSEIVGPVIAGHAEPTSLRNGVLRVRAASPAWATELGYLTTAIKERANELVGAGVVEEVRVWTGPGAPARHHRPSPREPVSARQPAQEVNPERDPDTALERAKEAWQKGNRSGP